MLFSTTVRTLKYGSLEMNLMVACSLTSLNNFVLWMALEFIREKCSEANRFCGDQKEEIISNMEYLYGYSIGKNQLRSRVFAAKE